MKNSGEWLNDGSFAIMFGAMSHIQVSYDRIGAIRIEVPADTCYITADEADGLIAALVTIRDIARRKERG